MVPITLLIQLVETYFIVKELDNIAFYLGFPYVSSLSGSDHTKIKNFVLQTYRRGRLEDFIHLCEKERPHVDWPDVEKIQIYRNQEQNLSGLIAEYFSNEEITDLCLALGFDFEDLNGTTKRDKITYMVAYIYQRGWLEDLIRLCLIQRPHVEWPSPDEVELPDDDQKVSNTQLAKILQSFYPDIWKEILDRQLFRPNYSHLLRKLRDHFNQSEIKDICFNLEIKYENLGGESLSDKTRELIEFAKRTQATSRLIAICQDMRPSIDWSYYGDLS